MTGLVCLQGGGEFSPGCREMDAEVLRRAGTRVAVVALAAAPGAEHDRAAANGVRHYTSLGADAVAAPDARSDPAGAVAAVGAADVIVLPGGSPSRLLDGLRSTPLAQALADHVAAGRAVSGSSAGAMVLGGWTVLPDRGPAVVPALAVVPPVLVVPHWAGAGRGDWLRAVEAAVPPDVAVLGLPEESGVLLEDGAVTAVGVADSSWIRPAGRLPRGTSSPLPGAPGTG